MEAYNCNSKEELGTKEGEYIKSLKPSLNTRIEGRTAKQRNEDNKDVVKAYHTQYYADNKERYKERGKAYYDTSTNTIKAYKKNILPKSYKLLD